MPELMVPTAQLHTAWLEAHQEWGPGRHEDGFGLLPSDEVASPQGFAAWVARLAADSDPAKADQWCCTYRWIVEGDRVHGGIALRHGADPFVLQGGHIGYGVRPSSRRRGLAGWALGRMLDEARAQGLERVLIVCEADNIASARTTEHHGGVLEGEGEGVQDGEFGPVRRYWIAL